METKRIRDLKVGEYFTLQPVECPKETVVWIRGKYERTTRKYSVCKWSDLNHEAFMKGDRMVYVDFEF